MYQDFLDRGLLLTRRLINQGFILVKSNSSIQKFYGRHHDLINRYGMPVSEMTAYMSHLLNAFPGLFLMHDLSPGFLLGQHEGCHKWNRNCLPFRST